MFHHNNRIAEVAQLFQYTDETLCVTAVQTDAWLVKNVQASHKAAAQTGGQIDALAFSARERVAGAVQCEIAQPHIDKELQPVAYLGNQSARNLLLVLGEGILLLQRFPTDEFGNGNFHKVGDAFACNLHVFRFRTQALSVAFGASGLSLVSGKHDTVLYLVLALAQHLKETVNADAFVPVCNLGVTVPQKVLLCLCKFVVWGENGETVLFGTQNELVFPFAHLFPSPAHHCPFIDAQ